MFCEESLRQINEKDVKLFQNGSVHEIYCLKALITMEQDSEHVSSERKKNFNEQWLNGQVL